MKPQTVSLTCEIFLIHFAPKQTVLRTHEFNLDKLPGISNCYKITERIYQLKLQKILKTKSGNFAQAAIEYFSFSIVATLMFCFIIIVKNHKKRLVEKFFVLKQKWQIIFYERGRRNELE